MDSVRIHFIRDSAGKKLYSLKNLQLTKKEKNMEIRSFGNAKNEPAASNLIKLDLACGQTPKEGYEGVDMYAPNAKYKINLNEFPWPWADSSVDAIYCAHFIEHIPAEDLNGKDRLFCFF